VTALAGLLEWAAREHRKLLLGFIGLNFLAMAVDCTLAHWAVDFYHPGMYVALGVPLLFGLMVSFFALREPKRGGRIILYIIATIAAGSGLLGLFWHLAGQFLREPRMQSLVYSAPLLGPLMLTWLGAGLWCWLHFSDEKLYRPLLLLAALGFLGLAVMALLDHAQNGFYMWVEWAPIIMGVFSGVVCFIGFANPNADEGVRRLLLGVAWAVLLVGLVGTFFHVVGFINHPAPIKERFALLAPPFAPLLFCDGAAFALLADLWFKRTPTRSP
jgi:hypothetical protein